MRWRVSFVAPTVAEQAAVIESFEPAKAATPMSSPKPTATPVEIAATRPTPPLAAYHAPHQPHAEPVPPAMPVTPEPSGTPVNLPEATTEANMSSIITQATAKLDRGNPPNARPASGTPGGVTPPPNEHVVGSSDLELALWQRLLARLRGQQRYPDQARRLGQEGQVLVQARFVAGGRLESIIVKRGSGFPLLDEDAVMRVRLAAAAQVEETMPDHPMRLDIPIVYALEE
jgi:protein TonB